MGETTTRWELTKHSFEGRTKKTPKETRGFTVCILEAIREKGIVNAFISTSTKNGYLQGRTKSLFLALSKKSANDGKMRSKNTCSVGTLLHVVELEKAVAL